MSQAGSPTWCQTPFEVENLILILRPFQELYRHGFISFHLSALPSSSQLLKLWLLSIFLKNLPFHGTCFRTVHDPSSGGGGWTVFWRPWHYKKHLASDCWTVPDLTVSPFPLLENERWGLRLQPSWWSCRKEAWTLAVEFAWNANCIRKPGTKHWLENVFQI